MRSMGTLASATLLAATVTGAFGTAPSARAADDGDPINGAYIATSVGEWAETNRSFHDEPTVHSTWNVTSSCTNAQECTGQVRSDQGWSAPLIKHDGSVWYVRRDVPNWEVCTDGTAATGHQVIYFVPVGPDGMVKAGSTTLAGMDKTTGPSGACGMNRWLVIEMPFRLDKLS